jgi:threonine dehydratase
MQCRRRSEPVIQLNWPLLLQLQKRLAHLPSRPGRWNWRRRNLETVIVVPDGGSSAGIRIHNWKRLKVLTEPAAACTLAAALRLKDQFNKNNNLVLIFCGGNVSVTDLCKYSGNLTR